MWDVNDVIRFTCVDCVGLWDLILVGGMQWISQEGVERVL